MASSSPSPIDRRPPGAKRPPPPPTKEGTVEFTPPGTSTPCQTYYFLYGDLSSNTPPLIALHGGPGAPGRSQKHLGLLWKDHGIPVVLYDQLGCGKSTHLRDTRGDTSFWTIDLFISELLNLVASLGIKTFDILGHSWGGVLASTLATRGAPGLRKVILSSCPVSTATRMAATRDQLKAMGGGVLETIDRCIAEDKTQSPEYMGAMREFMSRHLCRLDPWPEEINQTMLESREDDTVNFTLFGNNPFKMTGPMKDFDIEGELHLITEKTVPGGLLITNGKYDLAADNVMRPFFTQTKARVKWVRLVESSHSSLLEETEGMLTVLKDFLTAE